MPTRVLVILAAMSCTPTLPTDLGSGGTAAHTGAAGDTGPTMPDETGTTAPHETGTDETGAGPTDTSVHTADTGCEPLSWYEDLDGDGFGGVLTAMSSCDFPPSGWTWFAGDCDDSNADISPVDTEVCNGIDDDCNGVVDYDAADPPTWWGDSDGDGFGGDRFGATVCDPPLGFVDNRDDCDDNDDTVHPGAPETCDGADQDCDGDVDEDLVCP